MHKQDPSALSLAAVVLLVAISAPDASAQAGLSGERKNAIDSYLGAYLEKTGAPGFSCVLVKDSDIAYLRGFGVEYSSGKKPMGPDSIVEIGSLTKSFTCLAVMQLVEAGKIDLDGPVIAYLPWFRLADKAKSDKITVSMLMSNRSGIPSLDAFLNDADTSDAAIERGVRWLASAGMKREPGASFEYANENFNILGLIISEVSGLPYREYLRKNILEPLGMKSSSTDRAVLERLGSLTGHITGVDGFSPAPRMFPAVDLPAGGALACSARDMGAYLSMFLNGGRYKKTRLLSEEGVRRLFAPAVSMPGLSVEMGGSGKDDAYAMGWMRTEIEGVEYLTHGGNTAHMSSMTLFDPDKRMGASILFNYGSSLDPYRFEKSLRLCYNALRLAEGKGLSDYGIPRRKDPNLAEPFVVLSGEKSGKLTGSYVTPSGYSVEVSEDGRGLILRARKGGIEINFRLKAIDEFRLVGIGLGMTTPISVSYGENGSVREISLLDQSAFPKRNGILSGYALFEPEGLPWKIFLPADAKIARGARAFTASDDGFELSMSLEKGDSGRLASFLPAGIEILRQGKDFDETRRGVLYREQVIETEGGSSFFLAAIDRGGECLVIRLRSPSGRLTGAIQDILIPMMENSVY